MNIEFLNQVFGVSLSEGSEELGKLSTDTRTLQKNDFFIALKGENFDGNQFVEQALDKGARVVITSDPQFKNPQFKDHGKCIYVEDTLLAMQKLGRAWQNQVNPKVLAITGSNGKTTAKFFTYQLIRDHRRTSFSPRSYNNEIGVPITQLQLKKNDEVLISEIGMNAPGEIEGLTKMILPHASVVTTVGPAHIENFGTVEKIAIEKSQIYHHAARSECFLFNLDNPHTLKMRDDFSSHNQITFSTQNERADIFIQAKQQSLSELFIEGHIQGERLETALPVFGEHHVYNFMIGLAFGTYLGISPLELKESFKNIQTPWGRCQVYPTKQEGVVLFDAYNANLQSMKALLDSAAQVNMSHPQIILGQMNELGAHSKDSHKELGRMVGEYNFETICFIGEEKSSFQEGLQEAKWDKKLVISDTYNEKLAIELENMLNPSGVILMKGSRGVGLERLLPLWVEKQSSY